MFISEKRIILLNHINKNIEDVSKDLKISERSIRYRIESLNNFFMEEKIRYEITIENRIIRGNGNLTKLWDRLRDKDYDFSSSERVEIIYFFLLLQSYGCKADIICDFLNISRSTFKSDMKLVRKKLLTKNLEVFSKPNKGLILIGKEIQIRKLLLKECKKFFKIEGEDILFSEKKEYKKLSLLKENMNLRNISFIVKYLESIKIELNKKFSDEAYQIIGIYLLITMDRLEQGVFLKDNLSNQEFIKSTSEFKAVKNNISILEKNQDIHWSFLEILKITEFILGAHTYNFNYSFYENWIDIESLADDLIQKVGKKMNINISTDKTLREGIVNHLIPTIYRLKNGIELETSIYEEVLEEYRSLYYEVKKSLEKIEVFIGKEFSKNETSFFVIHFILSIKRTLEKIENKKKILIVCGLGYGISNLLKQELEDLFDIEVKDIIPLNHLREVDMENIDLIISTTTISEEGFSVPPIVKVDSLLNKKNITDLLMAGIQNRKNRVNIPEVINIMERHCKIHSKEELSQDLSLYFKKIGNQKLETYMALSLSDLLPLSNIKIMDTVSNWENAVREAGNILYQNGYIQLSYIEKMIEKIEELGIYMLIGDSILLPHAEREDNVMETGLSYLQLKQEVIFPSNTPIKHIFALCSKDKEEHVKGLLSLKQNIDTNSLKEKLESCGTVKEIHNLLKIIE